MMGQMVMMGLMMMMGQMMMGQIMMSVHIDLLSFLGRWFVSFLLLGNTETGFQFKMDEDMTTTIHRITTNSTMILRNVYHRK